MNETKTSVAAEEKLSSGAVLTAEKASSPADKFSPEVLPLTPRRVCFVCTGNTCRSPMAAAALNSLGARFGIRGESAGLYVTEGAPIARNAVLALTAAGIPSTAENNYKAHTARRLSTLVMTGCDLIIGMTGKHALLLIESYPAFASKITSFPKDISDPFGGGEDDYRRCLGEIIAGVRDMFKLYD